MTDRPLLLVVCSANICRSPVVEVLLRERFEARGLDVEVGSAGTLGIVGAGAAEHSAALMAERGLDLTSHASRAVDLETLRRATLTVVMEEHHAQALRQALPEATPRIRRLAELAGEPRDIPDPYGGPRSGYEIMVADVTDLIERGWSEIEKAVG